MVINGTGFLPKTTYTLEIVSSDPPPVDFTTAVTSDNKGDIVYAYQLDGNYRPNYTVYAKDSSGQIVATTTFTDSGVTVSVLSWNTIGVDSNKPVSTGPHQFVIQARVTNNTGSSITNVSAIFALGSGTSYITTLGPLTQNIGTLANNSSADVFFQVVITPPPSPDSPSNAVYGTSRNYTVTADYTDNSGAQVASYSNTLTILGLNSQNRNSILSTTVSPSTITVGGTFTVTVTSKTTGGGNFTNVSVPMMFDPNVAQMIGDVTTYQIPAGTTLDSFYDQNVGGDIQSVFTFKALAAGTSNFYWLIYDQSGGSYHYNSDYGQAIIITVKPGFGITKTPASQTVNPGGTASFSSVISNSGNGTGTISSIIDTLPVGFSYKTGSTTGITTNDPAINGQQLTWTGPWTITPGNSITINYQAIASTTPGTYTNSIIAKDSNNNTVGPATADIIIPAPTGSITIVKDAQPNSSQSFSYTTTGNGLSNFSLVDDGINNTYYTTFSNLTSGNYSITESPTTGWSLTNLSCLDNNSSQSVGSITSSTASLSLTAGQNVTCTYTNTRDTGNIVINKTAIGGDDIFGYAITGPSGYNSSQSIKTSSGIGTTGNIPVNTGSGYSVIEDTPLPAGWVPTSVVCNNGTQNVSNTNFSVSKGQTVTCTFTNTKLAIITVEKNMVGGTGTFNFTGNFSGSIDTNGGTITESVLPGTYVATESATTGWDLTDISCTGAGSGSGNLGNSTATFNVAAGQNETCTFTNTKYGSITVVKTTTNGDGTFDYTTTGGLTPSTFSITTTGGNGSFPYNSVLPGNYSITELTDASWQFNSLSCISGNTNIATYSGTTAFFPFAAGENVTCTYGNTGLGTLIIDKNTTGGDGSFGYTVNGASSSAQTINTSGGAGTTGPLTVIAGNYTVTEASQSGWMQNPGSSCYDPSTRTTYSPFNVTVGIGKIVTCTFNNTKLSTIKIVKDTNGGNGTFPFTTTGSLTPSTFNIDTIKTNLQEYDNVTPGSYSISETSQSGWDLTALSCTSLNGNSTTSTNQSTGTATITNLAAGDTVICTFTNTAKGSLTVNKITIPTGITTTFNINATGSGTITGGGAGTVSITTPKTYEVTPGTYYVSETPATGWTEDTSNCQGVIVAAGKNSSCTITNTELSNLTIVKNTVGGDGTFDFIATGSGLSNFSLTTVSGIKSKTFSNINSGTYSVAEDSQTGWISDTSNPPTCTNGDNPSSITLNPGDNVTCTFTNDKLPTLTVTKTLLPNSDLGKFNLLIDSNIDATNVGNGGTTGTQIVSIGSHTVSETAGTSTNLSDYNAIIGGDCAPDGSINLAAGDIKTCTITNTRYGSITIVKNTIGADGTFGFIATGSGVSNFDISTISNTGSQTFPKLSPGTFSFSENTPASWVEGSVSCKDNSTGGTVGTVVSGLASFSLTAGQNIICTFNNTAQGTLIIDKTALGGDSTFDYTVSGPTNMSPSITTTSGSGTTGGKVVIAGTYDIAESSQAGWVQKKATCDNGDNPSNVNVGVGDTVTCTFTNTKLANLTIVKNTVGGDGTFDFTTTGSGLSNFDLTTSNATASAPFADLNPGSYSVSETSQPGWTLTSSSCTNGDNPSNITLNPGDNVICYFENTKLGSITVTKYTDPGTAQTFNFTLTGLATGSATTNIGDGQSYTFNQLPPSVSYSLLENPTTGWDLTALKCISTNNNSTFSTDIPTSTVTISNLTPGDNVTCSFGNTESGNVIITKYNDVLGQGVFDQTDPTLSGWTMNLASYSGGMSQITDTNGIATFNNIAPTSYTLTENQQNGWQLTDMYCSGQEEGPIFGPTSTSYPLFVQPGQTIYCRVLNHNLIPILTITKTNDAGDNVLGPGSTVNYTITITATQSAAQNVTVTDLLPDGFHYNSGSWQALLNGNPVSVPEPTYHSPGTWTLGNMNVGDTYTLKYSVTIDGSEATGTYYDNAWGQGYSGSGNVVLANATTDPAQGFINDPTFVGTQVVIAASNNQGINYSNQVTQEVLGASTYLPATGENTLWVVLATLLGLSGLGMLLYGFKLRRNNK